MKSGKLNFLEHSGPLQACNGTALRFNTTLDHVVYGCGKIILRWMLKVWVMMARNSIWGSSLWWAVVNRLVITWGYHKRKWFVFRAGEFLMVSKEVLRRMQLESACSYALTNIYIYIYIYILGMVDFDWNSTQFCNWCSSWGMMETRKKGRTKIRRGRKRLQRKWRCCYRSSISYRHEP